MQLVAYGAQDVYLTGNPTDYFLEGDIPSPYQLSQWSRSSRHSTDRPISVAVCTCTI